MAKLFSYMGNQHIIRAGKVQVMSAGTGITHSEYNDSDSEFVNFLQIWVLPKITGIPPRYDQRKIDTDYSSNIFNPIVAPLGTEGIVNINQGAYFSIANIDIDTIIENKKTSEDNGINFFIIAGNINIGETQLSTRNGLGITEEDDIKIHAKEKSRVLCMEVSMR